MNKTLEDALLYCNLEQLPDEYVEGNDWTKGIALVVKAYESEFVVVENDINKGTTKIVKDFGKCISITKILAIYPYEFTKGKERTKIVLDAYNDKVLVTEQGGVVKLKDTPKKTISELKIDIKRMHPDFDTTTLKGKSFEMIESIYNEICAKNE